MAIVREYAGLTKAQSTTMQQVFEADGASVSVREDEGAYRLVVTYPAAWEAPPSSPMDGLSLDNATDVWRELVTSYRDDPSYTQQMKIASLSQWIIESGRGTSDLARLHKNLAGLKFRARMKDFAEPIDYDASDGVDTYCKFASVTDFIRGYWHFIDSGPYSGYKAFQNDAAGYIKHIAATYAGDSDYVPKVLGLFEEAQGLLGHPPGTEGGEITSGSSLLKLAVVVGHNSKAKGAASVLPIDRSEFDFNNEVADLMVSEGDHYNLTVKRFNRLPNPSYTAEITDVYDRVSKWGADVAVELHFNSNSSSSATGSEVLYASGSTKSKSLALEFVDEIGKLLNLPIRHGDGLVACTSGDRGYASLVAIDAPTALVEPFFGSSKADCLAAATAGTSGLARAYLRSVRDWAMVNT